MIQNTKPQPALYIPHGGGPCFFMEWNPPETWKSLERWLRGAHASLPQKPDAILIISAHWEEPEFTLTAHAQPPLIYDYYGFPPHTYALKYPAPGSLKLAQEAAILLENAGMKVKLDEERGFDHGVFIPLLLMFPDADIPVVQLSLKQGLNPSAHLKAGEALASLLRQNILILGSGMSYHNLRRFGPQGAEEAKRFDNWLTTAVSSDNRNDALIDWENAPAARECHPREEHLIPLMVTAGAAGKNTGEAVFSEPIMGITISAYRFG